MISKMRSNDFVFDLIVFILMIFFAPFSAMAQGDAVAGNKISSISMAGSNEYPILKINAEKPIGYRYTVYDSYEPVRIIIDLPETDVSSANSPMKIVGGPLQEIRATSFELPSGKLGRIELFLNRESKYKVSSDGNLFAVSFIDTSLDTSSLQPTIGEGLEEGLFSQKVNTYENSHLDEKLPPAKYINLIKIDCGKIQVELDGSAVNSYQYFHLRTPPRLVLDFPKIKVSFNQRLFKLSDGFSQIRIGESDEKTRLVLDSEKGLPKYQITHDGRNLNLSWDALHCTGSAGSSTEVLTAVTNNPLTESRTSPSSAKLTNTPDVEKQRASSTANTLSPVSRESSPRVNIEAIDFKIEQGRSILTISMSGSAELTQPIAEASLVRFGIKNANISKALSRSIDTSSFPSSVKKIIPYVTEGGKEVRFLSELREPVPFSLQQDKGILTLSFENRGYGESLTSKRSLPSAVAEKAVAEKAVAEKAVAEKAVAEKAVAEKAVAEKAVAEKAVRHDIEEIPLPTPVQAVSGTNSPGDIIFTGERISLVFDDANIRNILQLIGEVSNLNIIAGEDVKGTITLRLIDVPWDQALNLILESKNLGMLREGNVVRILPKEQIRALRQAEMTAAKEEKQLEDVVTEIIPINYTALGNITTPAKELLTDRGKITEDARNKQIIVTDIPSAIASVKKLSAILDTPERQVMIEARIVEASSSFGRDLGVKWGISYNNENGGAGAIDNASIGLGGSFLIAPPAAGSVMGNAGLGSGISFGRLGIDSTVLDLRISALESAGYGKVISTPRVSTLNGGTASISQGTKIPYQSTGDDGKAKTEFVDANLSLTVQPVINPDDSIILDISATNSSIGSTVSTGAGTAPAIDTKEAKTKVIVRNGETTVIGGIFVESENTSQAGVPLLMQVPIIGHLFRSDNKTTSRSELLVFITPRIVQ